MRAVFYDFNNKRIRIVHFELILSNDFTVTKDNEEKRRYIERRGKNENWDDPMAGVSLCRYILWNKPTIKESIKDYKKKFNLY